MDISGRLSPTAWRRSTSQRPVPAVLHFNAGGAGASPRIRGAQAYARLRNRTRSTSIIMWDLPTSNRFSNGERGAPNTVGSPASAKNCVEHGGTAARSARPSMPRPAAVRHEAAQADLRRAGLNVTSANGAAPRLSALSGTRLHPRRDWRSRDAQYLREGCIRWGCRPSTASCRAPHAKRWRSSIEQQRHGFTAPTTTSAGKLCRQRPYFAAHPQLLLGDFTEGPARPSSSIQINVSQPMPLSQLSGPLPGEFPRLDPARQHLD